MSQEILNANDLAKLVLAEETVHDSGLHEQQSAVARTFEKLNTHLSVRLGSEGYRALLKRAVVLAAQAHPSLASVRVSDNGIVEGLQNTAVSQSRADGSMAIIGRLIDLLDAFIGRELTIRMLHATWPNTIQADAVGRQGETNG